MVRLHALNRTLVCLAGSLLVYSCSGSFKSNTGTNEERAAKSAYSNNVQPIMSSYCGSCHTGTPNIDFMAPDPDARSKMLEWPNLVDMNAPASSRLVTYGQHSGPAFLDEDQGVVVEWLQLEKIAADAKGGSGTGGVDPEKRLAVFAPVDGSNTVDLEPVGAPGATLTFNKDSLATGMYLSQLQVNAGAEKLKIKHPLFVTWWEGEATPDPLDRFANIDLRVEENSSGLISGGTAVFVGVNPEAALSIHFEEIGPDDGGSTDGGDTGGGGNDGLCNDVAAFTQFAREPLLNNCANSCHGGGNQSATNATDMSDLDDTSEASQIAACAQILSRVNLDDPQQSGIFVVADPNSGSSHPFNFGGNAGNFTNYRDLVIQWINQEVSE